MFNTTNRGLAAALVLAGHKPNRYGTNQAGKIEFEFGKTPEIMAVYGQWKDKTLVGNIAKFNDALFEIHKLAKEITN